MSNLAQSLKACAEFKNEVLNGSISAAQSKLDKLKVSESRINVAQPTLLKPSTVDNC